MRNMWQKKVWGLSYNEAEKITTNTHANTNTRESQMLSISKSKRPLLSPQNLNIITSPTIYI